MRAAGCDSDKISELTHQALEKQGITEDDYEYISMVFPSEKTNCGYDHQLRLRCDGTGLADCARSEDTSHKTPMGGGGWEAVRVEKSGTYALRSLYGEEPGTGSGSGSAVRALDVPVGEDRLVVELRGASGTLDKGISGVHAYRVPKGDYANAALVDLTPDADHTVDEGGAPDADALPVGTKLTAEGGVTVEMLKSGSEGAKVAVGLDGEPAQDGEPAAGAGAEPQEGAQAEPQAERVEAASAPGTELAETGGDPVTVPVAAGGASLLALGAAFLLKARRRGATSSSGSSAARRRSR